jgi:hypothetical protein
MYIITAQVIYSSQVRNELQCFLEEETHNANVVVLQNRLVFSLHTKKYYHVWQNDPHLYGRT